MPTKKRKSKGSENKKPETKKIQIKNLIPVLKFLGIFGGILAAYFIFVNSDFRSILNPLLDTSAKITAAALSLFYDNVKTMESNISCSVYAMGVGFGCEGLDPLAIFLAVVIALPLKFKFKYPALLVGIPIILFLNLFRLFILFVIGASGSKSFELFHITIFPILFIIIVFVLLGLWQKWVINQKKKLASE